MTAPLAAAARPSIALATCATLPELFRDEQLLAEALDRRGIQAHALVWSSEEARTATPDLCLLRNTWDYYLHLEAFLAWAEDLSRRTRLWNPFPLVRWNAHKGYLLDLERRGIPVVPTALLPSGSACDLRGLAVERGWRDLVLKPAVSAGAHRTARFPEVADPAAQAHLDGLLADLDALVQPYQTAVEGYGERSFLFIDGELTHAVKRPAALTEGVGIERTMARVRATPAEARLARETLAALPWTPMYARVDLVPDRDGASRVMEVEVIEPRLFLQEAPHAVERLADALIRSLRSDPAAYRMPDCELS